MPTNIAISGISEYNSVLFVTTNALNPPVSLLKKHITRRKGIDGCGYYLVQDGRVLADNDKLDTWDRSTVSVTAIPRLLGGKGGFGSLIRAMGKSTQKSQNTEACRDLSGRRMRDVSTEKKLAQWIKDSTEKKKVAEEEKKARREQRRAGPKHIFNDVEYMNQIEANADNISDALKQGLAACGSTSGTKRPCAASEPSTSKKFHLWSGVDDLSDEELSNNEEETEENGTDNSSDSNKSDNGKRIVTTSIPQPTKTNTDSCENDDEIKENNSVDNNNQEVESNSVTPSTDTENVVSDKDKSSDVAEGKSEDDNTLPTHNTTNSTENGNNNETGTVEKPNTQEVTFEPIDLEKYTTAEELTSAVTPEHLKFTLQQLGLKCGGTPAQRGERLFATKGKSLSELDPSMFAKSKKQKK